MEDFVITLQSFEQGAAPVAHLDSLTERGGPGSYSAAANIDVLTPGILTQGPGLSSLTNGTQAGAITELVNHILDIPVTSDTTYAIAATKLHKVSSTTVTNSGGVFPHSITGATAGSSVSHFQGKVYYFYNKSSGADCGQYDLSSTFDDDYMSTVPTGAAALQNAPHPVAVKEDIMLFGNGRYVGTFVSTGVVLNATRLDFGSLSEVADVCFHANQWWIAVNYGVTSGTNRAQGQIYLYDGGATTALLSDEVAVGVQKIGFIVPINGTVYVAYQDLSGSLAIGYINGRSITPLCYFTGSLPTFAQKTIYKNFLLFAQGGLVYAAGAAVPTLPYTLSQHADGGYATVGALAAPFGTPMVASTESTNYKLAKFSGYDTACTWRSLIIPLVNGKKLGYIDWITVYTKNLGSNARCDLQLEFNQAQATSGTAKQITTANKRRHHFDQWQNNQNGNEDVRVFLDWANGNTSNDCAIRKIIIGGHWVEKNG